MGKRQNWIIKVEFIAKIARDRAGRSLRPWGRKKWDALSLWVPFLDYHDDDHGRLMMIITKAIFISKGRKIGVVQVCWVEQFANCQLEILWNDKKRKFANVCVNCVFSLSFYFRLRFKESRERRISWNNDLLSAAPIESEIWSRSDLLIISKAAKHTFYCWHTYNQAEENVWTKILISSDYFKDGPA